MDYIRRELERKFIKMNKAFKVLNVPGIVMGNGLIVCMTDKVFPIDDKNIMIPSTII